MTANRIRAVFFDLDGTLLVDDYMGHVVDEVGRALALRVGADPVALVDANRAAWATRWREMGDDWMLGRVPVDAITEAAWRDALTAVGVDDEAAVHGAVTDQWNEEVRFHRLFPEAREVLEIVRERGIPIVLVTNGASELQRAKLRSTGIESLFDAVLISSEVGATKPDAAIFDTGLRAVGVDAGSALMVGDNLLADVAGAKRAGMTGVWVDRHGAVAVPGVGEEPDATITDLRGLLRLL